MIALIQRVSKANVTVKDSVSGEIGPGLLVLLAVQPADNPATVTRMVDRVLGYRVFADEHERMNLSLLQLGLALLVVPQFTLAADTKKGMRASFTSAAPPDKGREYFDRFVAECRSRLDKVETGVFGADMRVSLVNEGPVTLWLEA